MKKIITLILVMVILIAGFVILKNKDEVGKLSINNPKANNIGQSDVKIENWSNYSNSQYGLSFSYPADFTVEEKTGYPKYVDFNSLLIKLGSNFELVVYDTKQSSSITSLETIPRLTKTDVDRDILSTNNLTNSSSVSLQVVKGVQYSFKNGVVDKKLGADTLSIVFMKGQNAYTINWSCWAGTACFNDEVVTKLTDSIKFTK